MCHHVSVSLRRPGELWHGVREGWHQESHSMLENKQTRVVRPRAWGSWHGDVSPPSWHEWHLLTFLPGSSWALSTPDMINLFIFPELRGHWSGMVILGCDWSAVTCSGLWLVNTSLSWPGLISDHCLSVRPGWVKNIPTPVILTILTILTIASCVQVTDTSGLSLIWFLSCHNTRATTSDALCAHNQELFLCLLNSFTEQWKPFSTLS